MGFFTAPVAFDVSRSQRNTLDDADFSQIESLFRELETEAAAVLRQAERRQKVIFSRTLMMRFVGQGAETDLPIERTPFQKWSKAIIRKRFDAVYQKLYGRTYPENPVEFVTFKVRASLPERPFRLPASASGSGAASPLLPSRKGKLSGCIKGRRPAFSLLKKKFVPFTVYDRLKLYPGAKMPGPAILEEKESTIVIGEDAAGRVDEFGFVWIEIK